MHDLSPALPFISIIPFSLWAFGMLLRFGGEVGERCVFCHLIKNSDAWDPHLHIRVTSGVVCIRESVLESRESLSLWGALKACWIFDRLSSSEDLIIPPSTCWAPNYGHSLKLREDLLTSSSAEDQPINPAGFDIIMSRLWLPDIIGPSLTVLSEYQWIFNIEWSLVTWHAESHLVYTTYVRKPLLLPAHVCV
jgi:hypothetical protein